MYSMGVYNDYCLSLIILFCKKKKTQFKYKNKRLKCEKTEKSLYSRG